MSFMYAYNNTFCSASGLQLSNVKRSHPSFFYLFFNAIHKSAANNWP